jgi:hypothetical protein
MSRRRTLLLSLAGIALLFLALPYIVWHPRRLNHDGFAKIELGMTQQEVEQLLGGPPGIYYPAHPGGGGTMTMEGYDVPDAAEFVWCDDKKRYEVWFNDQGIVVGKHQRAGWNSTPFTCRLTAMIEGYKEPAPLKPRRYTRPPADSP